MKTQFKDFINARPFQIKEELDHIMIDHAEAYDRRMMILKLLARFIFQRV